MAAKSAISHSGELKPKMQTEWKRSSPKRMKALAHTVTSCKYCLYVHLIHCDYTHTSKRKKRLLLLLFRWAEREQNWKKWKSPALHLNFFQTKQKQTLPSRLTQSAGWSMCLATVRWSNVGTDSGGIDAMPRSSILSLTAPDADVVVCSSAGKSWSGPRHTKNKTKNDYVVNKNRRE